MRYEKGLKRGSFLLLEDKIEKVYIFARFILTYYFQKNIKIMYKNSYTTSSLICTNLTIHKIIFLHSI